MSKIRTAGRVTAAVCSAVVLAGLAAAPAQASDDGKPPGSGVEQAALSIDDKAKLLEDQGAVKITVNLTCAKGSEFSVNLTVSQDLMPRPGTPPAFAFTTNALNTGTCKGKEQKVKVTTDQRFGLALVPSSATFVYAQVVVDGGAPVEATRGGVDLR